MATGAKPFAITVNWNRAEDTVQCVSSLLQGNPGVEVLVVDNGSEDGSVEVLRSKFPGLMILENTENMGYVKGVNQGIRRALAEGATHLLIINNDAVSRPSMVAELVDVLDRYPSAGIAGPKIFYYGTDMIWFNGGHFNHWMGFSTHQYMDSKDDGRNRERKVDFITGCTMMVKASVFSEVGLFDEDFVIYAEDLDLCLRAKEKKYESWLVPFAMAEHKVSLTTGIAGSNLMTPFRAYYYGRNMLMMIYKRKRGLQFITCFLGQTLVMLPYYFLLMGLQGTQGSFRHYMKGYNDAMRWMVKRKQ
jgi:GT2 family glycosyltransferase